MGTGESNSSHVRLCKINSEMIFQLVGILHKGFCDQTENSILFSVFIFLGQESYKIRQSVKGLLMVSKFTSFDFFFLTV